MQFFFSSLYYRVLRTCVSLGGVERYLLVTYFLFGVLVFMCVLGIRDEEMLAPPKGIASAGR